MRIHSWRTWIWAAVLSVALTGACAASKEATPELAAQARAQEYTKRFYDGDLAGLHKLFTPDMAAEMPFAKFAEMHRTVTEQLGGETEVLWESTEARPPYQRYLRRARFERFAGEIEVSWLLREDFSIAGVVFRPAEAKGGTP